MKISSYPCLILVTVPLFLVACARREGTFWYGPRWEETDSKQATYRREVKKISDTSWSVNDYYLNGNFQMKATVIDFDPLMKIDTVKYYYNGGQIFRNQIFKQGKLHGPALQWHINGSLADSLYYINDSLEGTLRSWHNNGQLETEAILIKDKFHGLWQGWHLNGQKRDSGVYDMGRKIGAWHFWYDNGKLKGKGERQNDSIMLYHWYHQNGKIAAIITYKHDKYYEGKFTEPDGITKVDSARAYVPASFPKGNKAERLFWQNKINSLPDTVNPLVSGVMKLEIEILENGDIGNIGVSAGLDPDFDKQIIKLAQSLPKMIPARQHNIPSKQTMVLHLDFTSE